MKNFFRTVFGKTTLFIIFTLCFALVVGSCVAAVFMVREGVYFTTEEDYVDSLRSEQVRRIAYSYVRYSLLDGFETETNGVEIIVRDPAGETIISTPGVSDAAESSDYSKYEFYFGISSDEVEDLDINTAGDEALVQLTTEAYYKTGSEIYSGESFILSMIHLMFVLQYGIYIIGFAALLISIFSFVTLMTVAGHKPGTDEVLPGPFIKIPFDLLLASTLCLCFAALFTLLDLWYDDVIQVAIGIILAVVFVNIFLGLCMSLAVRLKLHRVIKGSLIYMVLNLLWKFICLIGRSVKRFFRMIMRLFLMIPVVWRTVIIVSAVSLFEFIVILFSWYETDNLFLWWLLEKFITVPLVIFVAFSLRKLEKAGNAIAKGDLSYKTNTKGLYRGFRRHAENLNSISDAMAGAVEQRLRSERMKTELITNVSHDIKTPLTSIINYATLIGSEESDNPRITEYSSVLVRQSEKLKRLIEDLVEASKASTGNLEIAAEPCDASLFISQASGEYEDKIRAAGLTLITKEPDHEVRIMADTRRMWRVFDNLMNNACKYSQNGTRVYLSLEEIDGKAVVTLKNTSREQMNISADELMERFVRGDSSRNTEGNGLGLSIAKSLTELQGGEFKLDVDGDLFKVTLRFPEI